MKKLIFNKLTFKRSAISIAVSFCFVSGALAQNSEGSIYGRAEPKALITVTNVDTGVSRQVHAEADGSYRLPKLQPGHYSLTSGALKKEVDVISGSGVEVSLTSAANVVITGSRTRSAIDMSSTESNAIFTAKQIQALPVSRDTTSVSLLAPGTVQGSPGLGGLAAIGGASVAENAYYINGFDVTNIRTFTTYINLPFEAIAEQQVKTGGYGAQFGRSLGGVVALTTKSGTNIWQGGASVYYSPNNFFSKKPKNIIDNEIYNDPVTGKPQATPTRYISFDNASTSDSLTGNVYLGGPIIKDKLFIFGLIASRISHSDTYGRQTSTQGKTNAPSGVLKLDFNITQDHRLEFTGLVNNSDRYSNIYTNLVRDDKGNAIQNEYATSHIGTADYQTFDSKSDAEMFKYTGYLSDNFNISGQLGRVKNIRELRTNPNLKGRDCPWVLDINLNPMGCYDPNNNGRERDAKAPARDYDERKSGRLDLEYTWKAHTIRAGYDAQKFTSAQAGSSQNNSGGVYYRYYAADKNGTANNVFGLLKPNEEYVRVRDDGSGSGVYDVINTAKFIEDSWSISKDILLNTGLRWESFDNKNAAGKSFAKADNLLAPRIGAAWNVFGDGATKIFGNVGRYYIPISSNTNIRASRAEWTFHRFYTFKGKDPRTAAPLNLGPEIGVADITGSEMTPVPETVADSKLRPMSQYEYILGFQQALTKEWSVGVKYMHRQITDGMDDFCGSTGIGQYMKDKGYTKFNPKTLASCVIVNPGRDLNINVDAANDGKLIPVTIPNSYIRLAKIRTELRRYTI